jgi:electron transport complex protein RnfC
MSRWSELAAADHEMPCIRCGDCASACPVRLQPQQLLFDLRAGEPEQAARHGLADCSECGLCDQACPSRIALSQRFALAKAVAQARGQRRLLADAARERFQQRRLRLQRESEERAERDGALAREAASTDAVAAAIERAKARRQQSREQP